MASNARPGTQYRLVALDIDGTILTSAQEVTDELKACLARLADASVCTVLCTGRRWHSTVPVLRELAHVHPVVVCCGGALIKEADGERTLHRMPLRHGTARRAALFFRQSGLLPMLLFDRPSGEPDLWISRGDRECMAGQFYVRANPGSFEYYDADYPDVDECPLVVFALTKRALVEQAEEAIRQALSREAIIRVMRRTRYGPEQASLELHDPAATKWSALQWLLDRWGIRPEEVVAIGDDVNDLPMLRAAGLSFAMGNAPDGVKAAANAVTAPNDEHGVVDALASVFDL